MQMTNMKQMSAAVCVLLLVSAGAVPEAATDFVGPEAQIGKILSTLVSNGLKEVERVMDSQAVLIAGPVLGPEKERLLERFLFRIRAVNKARDNKYILLNAPNEALDRITAILPGIKSPTVMPLAQPGWSSVHTVISEDEFWERIEALKAAGAQGVLVIPIEKMVV
jgi:ATP phosphoribosyltransferase